MTYIGLIDERARAARRFEASLHGMTLVGDTPTVASAHNRSHSALECMKQRRMARGC